MSRSVGRLFSLFLCSFLASGSLIFTGAASTEFSCGFTLSSRQRIVVQREISRLKDINGERDYRRRLINQYKYLFETNNKPLY